MTNDAQMPDVRRWDYYPIEMPLTADGKGPATVGVDAARIAYEVWDRDLSSHASYDNLPDAINEAMRLNAALPSDPAADLCASGQQVRALEWGADAKFSGQPAFYADSEFGVRMIVDHTVHGNGIQAYDEAGDSIGVYPDFEAAKAAAQADYERRILSALTLAQTAQEAVPVAWMLRDMEGVICAFTTKLASYDAENWEPLYTHPPQPSETVAEAAEIERLTKERDNLSRLEQSHREQANEQFHRAEKAEANLVAARAENERLNNALIEAAKQISDLATRLGQAEGRLDASELVGVVEGWKARAEKAEAERDEARAQVAAAATDMRERAADEACYACGSQDSIRILPIDLDAQSALEAYGREKVREGMQREAEIIRGCCPECLGTGVRDSGGVYPWGEPISVPCDCTDAILGGMETIV